MRGKLYVAVPETAPHDPDREGVTEAKALCDRITQLIGAKLAANGLGEPAGLAKATVKFGAESGRAGNFTLVGEDPMAERMVREVLAQSDLGTFAVAAVFKTTDLMVAGSFAWGAA